LKATIGYNRKKIGNGEIGEKKMHEYKPLDIIKEVVWNLFIYVLYYMYCFVVLLIAHFILYRFIKSMQWTLRDVAIYALLASTGMMVVRIVGKIRKRK